MLTKIWRKNSTTKAPWSVGGCRWWRSPSSGNLGREFNCRKEIPDPDATILATDPVLAEVGGNSRGQLGQKRKLQEWEINDFRQWHLSKINVCLRVAPHLLLVDTFYLDQLIILSIMHWRIRGQHCEIPPDNHHQVPGSLMVINGWLRFAPCYKYPDKGTNGDSKRF